MLPEFVASLAQNQQLQVFGILMGLFGGLALFLYGMEQMTEALKAAAGERMRTILGALTKNRFAGVLTGALVTAVIQSSSVTTVLVVGFITSGLMSLSQSVGVIMGANIGTTITAQIIAFKVTEFALLLIAVGFGLLFFQAKEHIKQWGSGLMGLGLIFFGMAIMGDAMEPLRSYEPFLRWMTAMENPALGILAGAVFTAMVQSSSATTGIVIVLAGQGLISLSAGIALIFGANVGTCVTALLASIGKPREAHRAALLHVLFNLLGVLVWLPFIGYLADFVARISPATEALSGAARLAAETPRQIANAHTIFNVANTVIFVGFATQFARFVEYMVPDRPIEEEDKVRARYLDDELISTPSLALERARLEILRQGDRTKEMMAAILPAMLGGDRQSLREVAKMDDAVDALHGYIVGYLAKISRRALTESQTDELLRLMEAANDLENVGDIIETNLVGLGLSRIEEDVTISDETQRLIGDFHALISKSLDAAIHAVTQKSHEAAQVVIEMKKLVKRGTSTALGHQATRLVVDEPHRLSAYTIETDMFQNLRRIYYFTKRMARVAVPRSATAPDLLEG